MLKLPCPACGAEIVFKSRSSVFAVCSYCKSTVVRQDMNLEVMGQIADLQEDLSPFQVGTSGRYNSSRFELIGRLRIKWEDGFWNEWYALFDNGKEGWLAEAQGFYGMCFESENNSAVPEYTTLSPGTRLELVPDQWFEVEDIKKATCIGSEGELPFPAPKGRVSDSIDLTGSGEAFASIEYSDDGKRLYLGQYADFDTFQFSNLRENDDW